MESGLRTGRRDRSRDSDHSDHPRPPEPLAESVQSRLRLAVPSMKSSLSQRTSPDTRRLKKSSGITFLPSPTKLNCKSSPICPSKRSRRPRWYTSIQLYADIRCVSNGGFCVRMVPCSLRSTHGHSIDISAPLCSCQCSSRLVLLFDI